MPIYRDFTLTNSIKQIWKLALERDVIFDFSSEIEGRVTCAQVYNLLTNHRKAVRKHKLLPEYQEEWEGIQQVELRRIKATGLILTTKAGYGGALRRETLLKNKLNEIRQDFRI